MKKLLFIIPSALLLLAAGTLIFCKRHAERSGYDQYKFCASQSVLLKTE